MDIKNYLKTIDIDYRVASRRVEELEQKSELSDAEKEELERIKINLKNKEEEITLNRD
jgi:hypothetical protein